MESGEQSVMMFGEPEMPRLPADSLHMHQLVRFQLWQLALYS